MTWLPSKILPVTPGELKPSPRNARLHSPDQVNALAASITRFGFPVPILIDAQMNVIAGHGRLLAAQQLKLDRVPVIVIENMTAAERRAYMLADNQLALLSEWDDAKLSEELRALTTANVDLVGIGLDDLLAEFNPPTKPAGDLDVPAESTGQNEASENKKVTLDITKEQITEWLESCDCGDKNNRPSFIAHDECYTLSKGLAKRIASQLFEKIINNQTSGSGALV